MEFSVTKIVFSSSATVYGQPVYLPIDEEHPTGDCVNPYGKSKFFMEEIFKVNNNILSLHDPTVCLRMCVPLTHAGVALFSDISTLQELILQEK